MFPDIRLLFAALFASLVTLGCGFGIFAALSVSHQHFTSMPASTAPLQLVAEEIGPTRTTIGWATPPGSDLPSNVATVDNLVAHVPPQAEPLAERRYPSALTASIPASATPPLRSLPTPVNEDTSGSANTIAKLPPLSPAAGSDDAHELPPGSTMTPALTSAAAVPAPAPATPAQRSPVVAPASAATPPVVSKPPAPTPEQAATPAAPAPADVASQALSAKIAPVNQIAGSPSRGESIGTPQQPDKPVAPTATASIAHAAPPAPQIVPPPPVTAPAAMPVAEKPAPAAPTTPASTAPGSTPEATPIAAPNATHEAARESPQASPATIQQPAQEPAQATTTKPAEKIRTSATPRKKPRAKIERRAKRKIVNHPRVAARRRIVRRARAPTASAFGAPGDSFQSPTFRSGPDSWMQPKRNSRLARRRARSNGSSNPFGANAQ